MRPHQAAEIRTEPPVPVPMPQGARPAATATPVPELDPPGARFSFMSQGFHGVPKCVLVPKLPMATPTLCVLPSTIIPAPTSFLASVAVCGETRSCHTFEPPVVTRPSMSTMSFTATESRGTAPSDARGDRLIRARAARSASSA